MLYSLTLSPRSPLYSNEKDKCTKQEVCTFDSVSLLPWQNCLTSVMYLVNLKRVGKRQNFHKIEQRILEVVPQD